MFWRSTRPSACLLLASLGLTACHERAADHTRDAEPSPPDAASVAPPDAAVETDAMPSVAPGAPELCARNRDDAVRDVFCAPAAQPIRGLRQLQAALHVNLVPPDADDAALEAVQIDPSATIDGAIFLGHSTALSGRLVSPINPRVLLLGTQKTFLAFQRGIQQVELIALDRTRQAFNFYLLEFAQACNARAEGCLPGDLFTPSIERDWLSVTLHDDEELKNTIDDCRQCHQRARPEPMLLMRELQAPWTHFFGIEFDIASYGDDPAPARGDLADDYQLAKGTETYAGLPGAFTRHTVGLFLQNVVLAGQPLEFETTKIEAELAASRSVPRRSATWDEAYAAFKRGEQQALPHYDARPTDPAKQARLGEAYAQYRAGALPANQLPDLADIFPDDPRVRAELGLQTEPGASPAEALIQACGSCHNDVLDQTLTRARFNIALTRMSRSELDLAIERIAQPSHLRTAMPPALARQLDDEGKARLIDYLRANQRSADDDALLERAAALGMVTPRAKYPQL